MKFLVCLLVLTPFALAEEAAKQKRGLEFFGNHDTLSFNNHQGLLSGFDNGLSTLNHDHEHGRITHVTLHKEVQVPVPHPVPVHVEKQVPYPVKVPVAVKVDKPYAVHVPHHYPVHVDKPYPVKVEKTIPYPVKVPYKVEVPYKVAVPYPKPYPVPVHKPVPVHIPEYNIIKKPVPVLTKVHGGWSEGLGSAHNDWSSYHN